MIAITKPLAASLMHIHTQIPKKLPDGSYHGYLVATIFSINIHEEEQCLWRIQLPQEVLQSTRPVTSLTCSHTHVSEQLLLSRLHLKIPSLRSFRRQTKARHQQLCFRWSLYKQCFLLDIHDSRNSFSISTNIPESCLFALPPFLPSSLCMALQAQASLPGAHWYFLKENRASEAQSSTTWHLVTDWTSRYHCLQQDRAAFLPCCYRLVPLCSSEQQGWTQGLP